MARQQPGLHKHAIGIPRPAIAINLLRVFGIQLWPLGRRVHGCTGLVGGLALGNLCSGTHAYLTTRSQLHEA